MCLELVGISSFTHYIASWIPAPKGLVPGLRASHWPPLYFMTSIGLLDFQGMGLGSEKEAQVTNQPSLSSVIHRCGHTSVTRGLFSSRPCGVAKMSET